MRHQYERRRVGEASRAMLVLSIPTPREPTLERETTADDGNTHLKQAASQRSRGRSKRQRQNGSGGVVYMHRVKEVDQRGTLFLPGTRRARRQIRGGEQQHGARHRALSREQWRQLRGLSLIMLHLSRRLLYMAPKQRQDLFTTAGGAGWKPGGSVCFDLLSYWRSGKVDLAFPRRLQRGKSRKMSQQSARRGDAK